MEKSNGKSQKLTETLEELKSVPERDPNAAALGRARFLAEASAMRSAQGRRVQPRVVHTRRFAMNAFASIIVIIILFFGGSVGAAFAARDSLPGDALYSVKLFSENVRLGLVTNPDAEINLLMQFAQVRVTEMNELIAQGVTPPAEVQERLEEQIRLALELAAGMDDAGMQAALQRIRTQLEMQDQLLAQGTGQQVRVMLQAQIQLVDEGLADPAVFRNTIRNEEQTGQTVSPTEEPNPSTTPTRTPQETSPGDGSGAGGTPTPGGGQSPTTSPHNPQNTPGPTQEPGGQSTSGGSGAGGKP